MDNTWPCAVSIFAVLLAGGVFLVINTQTKAKKLEYILDDSDARFLLSDGHHAKTFLPILPGLSKLTGLICSGKMPEEFSKASLPMESFEKAVEGGKPLAEPPGTIPVDLAALIYTSGSTGNPKGVMMTHQAMAFTVGSLTEYLRLWEQDRILNVLPLAFDYGLYQLLMSVYLGGTIVLERSFTYPAQVFRRIKEQQVTVFPGVPTIFSTLVSMYQRKPFQFPSIQRVTNTAAALSDHLMTVLKQIFPNAMIYKMYGLTECKRVSYLEPERLDQKPNSVGKAIPGTQVFLLSQKGEPVTPGETGVLHVRGPHLMSGYWKQPELSRQMLKDGPLPGEKMLCTQDWFRMDDEGFLYFVGRSDDIIKTRGEKVSPVEVENALYGIPGIMEAAVVGCPDELLGEAIHAYVRLAEGAKLTEQEIKKACLSQLENYMVPSEVFFLSQLPKTASGKIQKKDLQREIVDRDAIPSRLKVA